MSESRARRVRRIFDEALDVDAGERGRFVEDACDGDDDLVREVLDLLTAREESGDFLESGPPAVDLGDVLPEERPGALSGTTVDGFRLTEEIARGGMGIVYRAEQDRPRRVVALKLMRAGILHPDLRRRFDVETRVLGRLQHPGIAQIFAAGTADIGGASRPYFAMELVEGSSIVDHASRNGLDVDERLGLVIRVCEAVQYAHQKGVVHRDLKPANILVDRSGRPKILDFGVARATESDTRTTTGVTSAGELLGTLAYMSPEQVAGRPDEIDTRADVYALGVLLYELLSDRLPHDLDGKPLTEAIRIVGEGRLRPLPVGHRVGIDLRVITDKALDADRDRRYASPSEMAADLGRYLRNEPIEARPVSAGYRFRKLLVRNRVASAFAAALLLAMIASGVGLVVQNRRILAAMDRAREEARTASEVSRFLEEMFRGADPSESGGDEVTARELLDRGAKRIDEELRNQPEVQRRLMRTMGNAYTALGLPDRAIPLLESALERTGDDDRPERVVLLARLAWAQQRSGNVDGALRTARRAVESGEAGGDETADEATAVALTAVGMMLREQGEFPRARTALERSLRIRERVLGPDHVDVGHSLYHLGWTLYSMTRSDEALQAYERACPIFERTLGVDHAQTAWCYNDHGLVLESLGRRDEGEARLREAYEIRQRILPPDHPALIGSATNLAGLYFRSGDLDRSRDRFAEVLDRSRERFDGDHPEVVVAITNLAYAEERLGHVEDGDRLLREALDVGRRLAQTNYRVRADTLANLGFYRMRHDRSDDGEALVRHALRILREYAGRTSSQFASRVYQLATALAVYPERLDDARAMLTEYLEIREGEASPNPRQIARARTHRGRLSLLTGHVDDGCADLERALPALENELGVEHEYVADAAFWLATCRDLVGRDDEASALYDRSVSLWSALRGEDDPDLRFSQACRRAAEGDESRASELLDELAEDGYLNRLAARYPHFETLAPHPALATIAGGGEADPRR